MKTIKRLTYLVILMIFTSLLIVSCNSNSNSTVEDKTDSTETDLLSTDEQIPDIVYQIPSPDELFSLIKNSGCKYKDDLLNSEKTSYESKTSQELNLGIYAADLAYLASFEKFQQSLKYFSKVKSMCDQMGLSTAIGSDMYNRLEKNMSNTDSLLDITNNSYYDIIQKLEETGNSKSLALIIASGWVESMYIAVNLVGKYSETNENIQRIASQKITFNNLLLNLDKYKDEQDVSEQITNLTKIKNIYEQIKKETVEQKANTNIDTLKVVIGQKSKYIFTKDLFESFKNEITALRNQIIKMS
ncbi:MAG: hypothetical protein A2X08_09250 [Bacteroidetes bacterium GWA2_32_17]|nr:MAG: hypothetical protein A2X08_09250 [Bacteroidetes bacterium GWA2_32_17]